MFPNLALKHGAEFTFPPSWLRNLCSHASTGLIFMKVFVAGSPISSPKLNLFVFEFGLICCILFPGILIGHNTPLQESHLLELHHITKILTCAHIIVKVLFYAQVCKFQMGLLMIVNQYFWTIFLCVCCSDTHSTPV